MVWMILASVIIGVLLFVVASRKSRPDSRPDYACRKLRALFTPAERSFLGVLDQAIGKDFRIFGKVRVADVLEPIEGVNRSRWQTLFNRISRKHFDFVLCSPDNLDVICVIELNDRSHNRRHRQDRDSLIEGVCLAAGVPHVSFHSRPAYDATEVRAKVAEDIARSPTHATLSTERLRSVLPDTATGGVPPTCPRCSSPMVRRTALAGDNAGKELWECAHFPECREIVTI